MRLQVYQELLRHGTSFKKLTAMMFLAPSPFDVVSLDQRYERYVNVFPNLSGELKVALAVVSEKTSFSDGKMDLRGAKPIVDNYHLFLLVFMYVRGGVKEFMAPFLSGVRVSQSQFSRLQNNATPVVAGKWASMYYEKRSLSWLLENAGPNVETTGNREIVRNYDGDLKSADIVVSWDGTMFKSEKSKDWIIQKQMHDFGKDKQHEGRIIVILRSISLFWRLVRCEEVGRLKTLSVRTWGSCID
jgi:hypothetical protein